MITRIEIDGFKSFKGFEMDFTPLTVIAGANASGKSNLFDAIQLLSRLAEVDLRTAFGEQRGDASELFLKYDDITSANEMSFAVEMLVDRKVKDNWGQEAELEYTRLRYELKIARKVNARGFEDLFVTYESLSNLNQQDDKWIRIIDEKSLTKWIPVPRTEKVDFIMTESDKIFGQDIEVKENPEIRIPAEGASFNLTEHERNILFTGAKMWVLKGIQQTVLSSFTTTSYKHIFAAREDMRSWKLLQFNPEDLREPTRIAPNMSDVITHSGKNLATALFRIKQDDDYSLVEISRTLNNFLPEFTEVNVENDKANKQFIIKLTAEDGRIFSSRVLSEGTLRLLALCVLLYDSQHKNLLCFEEPENGIHPCRIKSMIDVLKDLTTDFSNDSFSARQVIVNTHSPVLIGEMLKWTDDAYVSVWFANMTTLMTGFENQKYKIKVTKIIPVKIEQQTFMREFSEQEKQLSLAEVKNYLNTTKFN